MVHAAAGQSIVGRHDEPPHIINVARVDQSTYIWHAYEYVVGVTITKLIKLTLPANHISDNILGCDAMPACCDPPASSSIVQALWVIWLTISFERNCNASGITTTTLIDLG